MFTRWAAELRDGVAVLGPDSPAGARMAETVRYFEFISGEMTGLLARWDSRNADRPNPANSGPASRFTPAGITSEAHTLVRLIGNGEHEGLARRGA